jgi:phosphoribosylaminoimidazole (AIR) synthetase
VNSSDTIIIIVAPLPSPGLHSLGLAAVRRVAGPVDGEYTHT